MRKHGAEIRSSQSWAMPNLASTWVGATAAQRPGERVTMGLPTGETSDPSPWVASVSSDRSGAPW